MRYLFILTQSPYQSSLAREALDFALASAAFNQQVSLLFMGDGVFQLLADQQSQSGKKNIEKTLSSLALFDIESVYYHEACALERHIIAAELSLNATPSNAKEIQLLIHTADKVFNF